MDRPLWVEALPRARPWGGRHLGGADGLSEPTGELLVAGPAHRVVGGPFDGWSLDDLAAACGDSFLGFDGMARRGGRFPLLTKIIDAAAWLSVQVHPDDTTARRLVGPETIGKTEAWHVIAADPEARLIVGPRPGVGAAELQAALGSPELIDLLDACPATAGMSVTVPAGTLHAIGPGVLLFEIQQPSDTTFRVYDWDRPAGPDRPLHLTEASAALDPVSRALVAEAPTDVSAVIAMSPYFRLRRLRTDNSSIALEADGSSVRVVTVTEGEVQIEGPNWIERLTPFRTVVLPASLGAYRVASFGQAVTLIADVPPFHP